MAPISSDSKETGRACPSSPQSPSDGAAGPLSSSTSSSTLRQRQQPACPTNGPGAAPAALGASVHDILRDIDLGNECADLIEEKLDIINDKIREMYAALGLEVDGDFLGGSLDLEGAEVEKEDAKQDEGGVEGENSKKEGEGKEKENHVVGREDKEERTLEIQMEQMRIEKARMDREVEELEQMVWGRK